MADIIRPDLVRFLRESLSLQSPEVETDEMFKFEDPELESILKSKAKQVDPSYDLLTLPPEDVDLLMLLGKKEVYWRLASDASSEYPLSVEGIKLNKDQRFKHFLSLIQECEKEYQRIASEKIRGKIIPANAIIRRRDNTTRNHNLRVTESLDIFVDKTYEDKVELSWSIPTDKSMFKKYELFSSEEILVDEYVEFEKPKDNYPLEFTRVERNKARIEHLKPNTQYFVALVYTDILGNYSVVQTTITTGEGVVA